MKTDNYFILGLLFRQKVPFYVFYNYFYLQKTAIFA